MAKARLLTLPATFAIAVILTGCADPQKAATLDRPTALKLLREKGDLFKGQELVYEAKTHERVTHTATNLAEKRGSVLIEFLDVLADLGVLNQKTAKETASVREGFPPQTYPAVTDYAYAAVEQEGVKVTYANSPNEFVTLKLGTPTAKEILGIRQEGSDALVEVSIGTAPTPLYEKIMERAKKVFTDCEAIPAPKYDICSRWPSRNKLAEMQMAQFHFVRYDDGWRVAEQR